MTVLRETGRRMGRSKRCEPVELAVDAQVVVALLGEVDAGIEDDLLRAQAGASASAIFSAKNASSARHDVVVADVRVRHLRLADAVHDEQRRAVLGAEFRIARVGQRADVIEDVAAEGEDAFDDFAAPGVDGKQGFDWFDLVAWFDWIEDVGPALR